MPGIKDVARRAGVGVATVSRVINNSGYVSEETKDKIEKAMKELDYMPNELARNLFRNKSGIIAVLVPALEHPFFSEFVNQVESALHEKDIKLWCAAQLRIANMKQSICRCLRNVL